MKDTLHFILTNIVENTEALSIEEQTEDGKTIYIIHADQSDLGRIIGKHGRIIKAIRDVIKIMAIKQDTYVDIMIAEQPPETPAS